MFEVLNSCMWLASTTLNSVAQYIFILFGFFFTVAQTVKRLPAMRKNRVQSLGWEDPLEKEMTIHSSKFARKIPWTEEPGRLQPIGSQRVRHN